MRKEKTRQKDVAVRKEKTGSDKPTQLRRRAEKLLDGNPEAMEKMPSKDVRNLIEELRIHQIELEMQNDELRRSQLKLQEARDRYLDLYDFAPTGYMTLNQGGLIIESNLTCAELLGVERSRLINSRFSAFVAPDFQDEYYLYVKRALQATGKQTCELGLKTKDGIPLYVQLQGLALQDPEADSSQLRLAMTDVTERKETEEALRETEKRYRDLYENAPNAYFSVSPTDGSILRCNSAALGLLGYDRETMMNMNIQDIYADTPHNMAKVASVFKRFKAGESVRDIELQMQRKDGEPLWISLSIKPVKDGNGNVIESRSMVIDISERKRAEEALRRAHDELEKGVEERTAELVRINEELKREIADRKRTQQALRKSEERVRKVNVALDQGLSEVFQALRKIASGDPSVRIPETSELDLLAKLKQAVNVTARDLATIINLTHEFAMGLTEYFDVLQRVSRGDFTARVSGDSPVDLLGALKRHINQMIQDISTEIAERKRSEQALEESEAALRRLSARLLHVQEAERKTISRELHDSIGQALAATKFGVENCLYRIREVADKETVKSLQALVPVVRRASEEVRRIHTDLRPSLLDDLGIIATISWFCREFQGLYSGLRVEQRIDIEEKQVADSLKIVIFRLLQEALNNVAKYGKGDTVRVSLRKTEGHIELAIEDNGQGFDVEQVRSTKSLKGGFGLTSMKERTELSGGSFSIESVPGAGTLVRASWPTRITEPA